jgi:hypothetical protein
MFMVRLLLQFPFRGNSFGNNVPARSLSQTPSAVETLTGSNKPIRTYGRIGYAGEMFVRKISVQRVDAGGVVSPCPIHWIDNFAMRNFTNDAVFDDTLPVTDGLMEAGHHVPLERLAPAMEDWFRRKGYLKPGERLVVEEM